ncbi:MAG: CoB--CoM heterodisulfide reductase iron-sulfur subunit A family protein, partial [Deltaproteobacteria bacterium]|nr:CoB--CoM heterodisulfide reductase iron-sulfur subunit A family protein [Deltaproteobacteria bacterium]
MEKKSAVYICTGCGIGDALDIDKLELVATDEFSVPICRRHANLCGKEGVELIKKDMADEGVNTIAIAACSPRVMYDVFNFDGCIVDRINLREQVVWSQKENDEDTQMMAEDYMRMGITKINGMQLPEGYKPEEEFSRDILVVGGGLTGLNAALEGAKAGYSMILVEKENELGGFQKNVKEIAVSPYKDVTENDLSSLIKKVRENEKIT